MALRHLTLLATTLGIAGCGGGTAARTIAGTQATTPAVVAPRASSPAFPLPKCVTGLTGVEFLFYGPHSRSACELLRARLVHAFSANDPSLLAASFVNEQQIASDARGDAVIVLEIGADNGDVNTLAAGVLAGLGYHLNSRALSGFMGP